MIKTLLLLIAGGASFAQTIPNAVPAPTPVIQWLDQNGHPLAGAFLCTFAAGTTTPQASYTDSSAGTSNANPIVLDSAGRAQVWIGPNAYKFVLYVGGTQACPSTGAVQWTEDNLADTTLNFVNFVKTAGTATLITYTDPITGAVQRTVSSRLADRADLKDFGAVCDGTTDDTTAIQAAINQAASAGVTLYGPSGACLATALTLPSNLTLTGQGAGQFIIRAKTGTAIAGTPFIRNATQSGGGNSNITLSNLTIDGNMAGNGGAGRAGALNQEIPSLSLIRVTGVSIDNVTLVNSAAAAIYGYYWTGFSITNSSASNYGFYSSTWPNTAAVQLDYNNATGPSTNIKITGNSFDGSGQHVGGIKLAGDSGHLLTNVTVENNRIITGDANAGSGGATLGVELYSNSGLGFFECNVSGNLIRGETASSPLTAGTGATWGISLAGAGGQFCTVAHNVIRWVGAYSIETGGSSHIAITGNSVDTAAQIAVLGAPAAVAISDISITGNVLYNPVQFSSATLAAPAIFLYSAVGSTLRSTIIESNAITYVANPAGSGIGIWAQCNAGGGSITDTIITGNTIYGPGSGSLVDGITLEQDGTCPVLRTQVRGNTLENLLSGIHFGTDVDTQVSANIYKTVGASFRGTIDPSVIFSDVAPSANYTNAWSTLNPGYNILFTKPGQYFQTNGGLASYPNVLTWNTFNGGNCTVGGIISSNTAQNTPTNAAPNGWTQSSTGAFTRAAYYQEGACRFTIAFGPATGAGPNPPSDNNAFLCEDTAANTGSLTVGGCGFGNAGINSGSRIQNVWTASATWNPGTIPNNSTSTTALTVTGCAAGNLALANLSTLTASAAMVTALAATNQVNVYIYNVSGGNLTPGSGTVHVTCIATN
jgi:hypothetical protein